MKLLHEFRDPALLETALTHPSYAHTHKVTDNQRMEFLGDAVLELVVSEILLDAFPAWDEGKLSKARASIVNTRTLAGYARALELVPRAERALETRGLPQKALADTFEAVLAAVYLDAGLDTVRAIVGPIVQSDVAALPPEGPLDPVSRLQQIQQAAHAGPPTYTVVAESGEAHAKVFHVTVRVGEETFGPATGASKKAACAAAAEVALNYSPIEKPRA